MAKKADIPAVRKLKAGYKMSDLIQSGVRLGSTTQTSREYKVMAAADKVQRLARQGYRLNPAAPTSSVYRRTAAAGDKWAQQVRDSFAKKPKVR